MSERLASVGSIGEGWGARAALGDAMSEAKDDTRIIILMYDEQGNLTSRAANLTHGELYWMLSLHRERVLHSKQG